MSIDLAKELADACLPRGTLTYDALSFIINQHNQATPHQPIALIDFDSGSSSPSPGNIKTHIELCRQQGQGKYSFIVKQGGHYTTCALEVGEADQMKMAILDAACDPRARHIVADVKNMPNMQSVYISSPTTVAGRELGIQTAPVSCPVFAFEHAKAIHANDLFSQLNTIPASYEAENKKYIPWLNFPPEFVENVQSQRSWNHYQAIHPEHAEKTSLISANRDEKSNWGKAKNVVPEDKTDTTPKVLYDNMYAAAKTATPDANLAQLKKLDSSKAALCEFILHMEQIVQADWKSRTGNKELDKPQGISNMEKILNDPTLSLIEKAQQLRGVANTQYDRYDVSEKWSKFWNETVKGRDPLTTQLYDVIKHTDMRQTDQLENANRQLRAIAETLGVATSQDATATSSSSLRSPS